MGDQNKLESLLELLNHCVSQDLKINSAEVTDTTIQFNGDTIKVNNRDITILPGYARVASLVVTGIYARASRTRKSPATVPQRHSTTTSACGRQGDLQDYLSQLIAHL